VSGLLKRRLWQLALMKTVDGSQLSSAHTKRLDPEDFSDPRFDPVLSSHLTTLHSPLDHRNAPAERDFGYMAGGSDVGLSHTSTVRLSEQPSWQPRRSGRPELPRR